MSRCIRSIRCGTIQYFEKNKSSFEPMIEVPVSKLCLGKNGVLLIVPATEEWADFVLGMTDICPKSLDLEGEITK